MYYKDIYLSNLVFSNRVFSKYKNILYSLWLTLWGPKDNYCHIEIYTSLLLEKIYIFTNLMFHLVLLRISWYCLCCIKGQKLYKSIKVKKHSKPLWMQTKSYSSKVLNCVRGCCHCRIVRGKERENKTNQVQYMM